MLDYLSFYLSWTFQIFHFLQGSKKVLFWNSAIHDGKSNVFYTFEHEMKITLVEWTTENQVAIGFMNGLIEIWKMDENESKFLTKFKISDVSLFGSN